MAKADAGRGAANLSSALRVFVLERALKTGLPRRTMLTAMGPGFSASSATLLAAA